MMSFIPSPVDFDYDIKFSAVTNVSGRMQYYRSRKGKSRIRISRNEFMKIYNNSNIIAFKPIQNKEDDSPLQMDIYVKNDNSSTIS